MVQTHSNCLLEDRTPAQDRTIEITCGFYDHDSARPNSYYALYLSYLDLIIPLCILAIYQSPEVGNILAIDVPLAESIA